MLLFLTYKLFNVGVDTGDRAFLVSCIVLPEMVDPPSSNEIFRLLTCRNPTPSLLTLIESTIEVVSNESSSELGPYLGPSTISSCIRDWA